MYRISLQSLGPATTQRFIKSWPICAKDATLAKSSGLSLGFWLRVVRRVVDPPGAPSADAEAVSLGLLAGGGTIVGGGRCQVEQLRQKATRQEVRQEGSDKKWKRAKDEVISKPRRQYIRS